jgi:hypothetical protein
LGVYGTIAYRDKKVVGVFVRFRAPLQPLHQSPRLTLTQQQQDHLQPLGVRSAPHARKVAEGGDTRNIFKSIRLQICLATHGLCSGPGTDAGTAAAAATAQQQDHLQPWAYTQPHTRPQVAEQQALTSYFLVKSGCKSASRHTHGRFAQSWKS